MKYDLLTRTKEFSVQVIKLLKTIKTNNLNKNIIDQLLRSATSVGANYAEATNASSKRDFRNKIFICKKEIQESKYWIELLAEIEQENKDWLRKVWQESHELTLIFNTIAKKL